MSKHHKIFGRVLVEYLQNVYSGYKGEIDE